jgi:hypothetical protein
MEQLRKSTIKPAHVPGYSTKEPLRLGISHVRLLSHSSCIVAVPGLPDEVMMTDQYMALLFAV